MSDTAVSNLAYHEQALRHLARKLARLQRNPNARELAELARLKENVREAKERL